MFGLVYSAKTSRSDQLVQENLVVLDLLEALLLRTIILLSTVFPFLSLAFFP